MMSWSSKAEESYPPCTAQQLKDPESTLLNFLTQEQLEVAGLRCSRKERNRLRIFWEVPPYLRMLLSQGILQLI